MRHAVHTWTAALMLAATLSACEDRLPTAPTAAEAGSGGPRLGISTAGAAPYKYYCGTSLAPSQVVANTRLRDDYELWRARRVWSQGAGVGERVSMGPDWVFDIGNGSPDTVDFPTVSEGQGYGMLLAVYMGDKAIFDKLWTYAKAKQNNHGLMAWAIDANGVVMDSAAASDGDEDIAFSLLVADKKWGGYWNDLNTLVGNMKQQFVDPTTYVFKSGDWSGTSALRVHPGYLDPAYYKDFAMYLSDPFWNNVADKSYTIFANIDARSGINGSNNTLTGLVPDRAQVNGDPVTSGSYRFSWNAHRTPWRLAKDAVWGCDSRAEGRLDRMNSFFSGVGATNIKTGYALNGTVVEQVSDEVAFVGPLTAAALSSTDATYRTAMWNETVDLGPQVRWDGSRQDTVYYAAELRLMGMLLASGNMEDPLSGHRRRRIDDFELNNLTQKWWPYTGSADTVTRARVTPGAIGHSMKMTYAVTGFGGLGYDVMTSWADYRALEFWFKGTGSGNTIRIQIEDADGEIFQHAIVDDFTGWKFASVPLNTAGFPRASWQPAGVPNNGFTLTNVKTLQLIPSGRGSFEIDRIELIPNY